MNAALADQLTEQVSQVDARVAGAGGAYADEPAEIRRAVGVVDELTTRLGLGSLVRNHNPGTGKPQVLLEFLDQHDQPVVLKVYGRPRPNEAAVQGFWAASGVPAAPVLAAGDSPVSWLLMPRLPGSPPTRQQAPALTGQVAAALAIAHRLHSPDVGEPRDLFTGLTMHYSNVLAVAVQHGYRVPDEVLPAARTYMSAGRPTFLHGDLAPANLVVHGDSMWLVDTCGYTGPAEFDAARWSARVGGSAAAEDCLRRWSATEALDVELARRLLGLELFMEAGVREIIKDERGIDASPRDPETRALLIAGSRLLGVS